MMIQDNLIPAVDLFRDYSRDSKIILFHPSSRWRSVLLASLISDPSISTFYYAMGIDDINLRNFLIHIVHDMSDSRPTFGRHLNNLSSSIHNHPYRHIDLILETFVTEMTELDDGEFYFILDEYDRADKADDVQRFVERLSHLLPARCKLVLNSRTLPRMPWLAMIAKGHAVMLSDDKLVTENHFDSRSTKDAELKVLSLGPGYVFLGNRLIEKWEGHLPRLLLFFALDRPVITRNEICETFWPNLELDPAVNVFHVTKRRLHKALDLDVLMHDGSYYRINPDIPFYSDTFEFVELLMVGRHGNPADPLDLWQRVAKLYRGPFLQGHDDTWIEERRAAYRNAYVEALDNTAQLWDDDGKHELALHTLLRAVDTDFSNETLHKKLIKMYVRLGRRAETVAHFRSVEKWSRSNKIPVSDDLRQLFSDITA